MDQAISKPTCTSRTRDYCIQTNKQAVRSRNKHPKNLQIIFETRKGRSDQQVNASKRFAAADWNHPFGDSIMKKKPGKNEWPLNSTRTETWAQKAQTHRSSAPKTQPISRSHLKRRDIETATCRSSMLRDHTTISNRTTRNRKPRTLRGIQTPKTPLPHPQNPQPNRTKRHGTREMSRSTAL